MTTEPKTGIIFSHEDAGTCDICRRLPAGRGLVGWRWPVNRPICDLCLESVAGPLGVWLGVVLGLRELASLGAGTPWQAFTDLGLVRLARAWAGRKIAPSGRPDPARGLLSLPTAPVAAGPNIEPAAAVPGTFAVVYRPRSTGGCVACSTPVNAGFTGWSRGARTGVLCAGCLQILCPPLGQPLALLAGLPPLACFFLQDFADRAMVALIRLYHHQSEGQWPIRPRNMFGWMLNHTVQAPALGSSAFGDRDHTRDLVLGKPGADASGDAPAEDPQLDVLRREMCGLGHWLGDCENLLRRLQNQVPLSEEDLARADEEPPSPAFELSGSLETAAEGLHEARQALTWAGR